MRRTGGAPSGRVFPEVLVLVSVLVSVPVLVLGAGCNAILGIDSPRLRSSENECIDGTAHCGVNAHCVDTDTAFTCMCDDGYQGDGLTCTDVDECAASPCDANASCHNTAGAFTCLCNTGYEGNGTACADVDECSNPESCDPHAMCANLPGSFSCTCATGYTLAGASCIPTRFSQLSSNGRCAVAADGTIWCWGRYPDDGVNAVPHPRPTQVVSGTDWTFVESSETNFCGLRSDHTLWCWGDNTYGQLGDATQQTRATPQKVNATMGWTTFSVDKTTCGIQEDKSLWCWGESASPSPHQLTPRQVGVDRDWVQVDALPHLRVWAAGRWLDLEVRQSTHRGKSDTDRDRHLARLSTHRQLTAVRHSHRRKPLVSGIE